MITDTRFSVLDAAALCAERGLHVIPVWRAVDGRCPCPRGNDCVSPGKHPAIDSWQTAASTDLTVLRDWFASDRHNIGVVCAPSGIAVIDIDPRNGGTETFSALTDELGPLPATPTADSGGGGTHYLFKRPTGDLVSKLGPGVDLLHGARQILVEPSTHVSGTMYRWRAGQAPDEIALAALPEAWLRRSHRAAPPTRLAMPLIVTSDIKAQRARRYLEKIPGAVSGDGGHTATFNAVAHVMIGFDLDPDTTLSIIVSDYNPRCDPPWPERELLHKIRSVAETCKRERGYLLQADRRPITTTQQAADHIADRHGHHDDESPWTDGCALKADGTFRRAYVNVQRYVGYHPNYRGRWALDTMSGMPWFNGAPMRATLVHEIRGAADHILGYTPAVPDVEAAISQIAEQRPFHPIQQYLRSIDWDGQLRLSTIAREYLGSDDSLHAEMVRKWMIGAAARALRPGCKLDTALMLYGAQGIGKSTFFSTLGGTWHADSFIDITSKDSYGQLHSAWIYELSELENVVTGRAESRLKAWLTSTHDIYRRPYAKETLRHPRSVALCGTTNRQQILTDDTGSRRFWIVPVAGEIDVSMLKHARDQLWAEAVAALEAGEPWWLDRDLEREREIANADFVDDDPWTESVAGYLANPTILETTTAEILREAIKLDVAKQDHWSQRRAGRAATSLGWRKVRRGPRGYRSWVYLRPSHVV